MHSLQAREESRPEPIGSSSYLTTNPKFRSDEDKMYPHLAMVAGCISETGIIVIWCCWRDKVCATLTRNTTTGLNDFSD